MKKVYVILDWGEYESECSAPDMVVVGVFTSKQRAEKIISEHYNPARFTIQERELDCFDGF